MMRCPLCGGDFPKLTGHVHDPEGMKMWDDAKTMRDIICEQPKPLEQRT